MMRTTRLTACFVLLAAACHHPHAHPGLTDLGVADQSVPEDLAVRLDLATPVYSDFPSQPQIDPTLPANVGTEFTTAGDTDAGGTTGPCIIEPSMGALFPNNWTPMYFAWNAANGDNLFELRLHVANQLNDLVVYTSATTYTLPATIWTALATDSADLDIEVTIRSATLTAGAVTNTPSTGTTGAVRIAPVAAPGSIVYWTTSNATALKGYTIGAPMTSTIITPALMADGTTCVGCHTSSPDGKYAFLTRAAGTTSGSFSIDARTVDGTAAEASVSDVSANALMNLQRTNQNLPVLSLAHYSATDAVVITTLSNTSTSNVSELAWTDLHATTGGTGILLRTGDPAQAALPSWSHDGSKIVYVSTTDVTDGRANGADTNLYIVPYNNHAGGTATAVTGAADPTVHEYYPVFSPDDKLIAYNESPSSAGTYDEPTAELRLIPTAGGTSVRLAANDPPACANTPSPGITNSWPRWSPDIEVANGKSYFWLVFSSRRLAGALPQLYVAAVVVDGSNNITTYPAIYISAQPPTEANHTPAWDVFKIPPIM
jgi:hypothetical protein